MTAETVSAFHCQGLCLKGTKSCTQQGNSGRVGKHRKGKPSLAGLPPAPRLILFFRRHLVQINLTYHLPAVICYMLLTFAWHACCLKLFPVSYLRVLIWKTKHQLLNNLGAPFTEGEWEFMDRFRMSDLGLGLTCVIWRMAYSGSTRHTLHCLP